MIYQFVVPVHFSAWSQQPDVRIECDQSFGTPAWGQPPEQPVGVYRLDDGRLYTFSKSKVTCEACKARMTTQGDEEP